MRRESRRLVLLLARSGASSEKEQDPLSVAAGFLVTSQIAPRHRDTSTGGSYGTGPSPWFRRSRRWGGVSLTVPLSPQPVRSTEIMARPRRARAALFAL